MRRHLRCETGRLDLGLWAGVLGALLATGCDRGEETRAALLAEDAVWSGRLVTLRARQADIAARYGQRRAPEPARATPAVGAFAAQARLLQAQALVEGSRQTLANLDTRRREIVGEVEAALNRDAREGEELFARASADMARYLATEEEALTATDEAVAGLATPERSTR
jgi:hypothetical protein